MKPIQSPTPRLLFGFGAIITISVVSSLFVLMQISDLRRMQAETIERNRRDAERLLHIQQQVNALGEAMRDVATGHGARRAANWRAGIGQLRADLNAAFADAGVEQTELMAALDRAEETLARSTEVADQVNSREIIVAALQKQQAALTRSVTALMQKHTAEETHAAAEVNRVYDSAERNRYVFVGLLIVTTVAIAAAASNYNRRVFDQLHALSDERQMLARGLITVQEGFLKTVSRELHDEFGQILTALNALLHRAGKKHLPEDSPVRADIDEVRSITQETLEKTREFSQSLRPAILDDYGLARAIERQVATFEKRHGIATGLEMVECEELPSERSIHVYRVLQEALSNVARHSNATAVTVRFICTNTFLLLEILDNGIGINAKRAKGLGLVAMRERAELLHGRLSVESRQEGGTRVCLNVPIKEPQA